MFSNRVEITLYSVLGTKVLHKDPPGYKNSETEIGRSEKTFGIFIKQINNLEFIGEAKQYLENLWQLHGVHAKCRMVRKEMHPTTDDWRLHSEGFLDFSSRKIKDGKLQINFVEGGLREILTSQLREKFELNRTTDIEGNTITPLKRDDIQLNGRKVFLRSEHSSGNTTQFEVNSGLWNSGNDFRTAFQCFPMDAIVNADSENVSSCFERPGSDNDIPGADQMFYLIADRDRGQTDLKLTASFTIPSMVLTRASDLSMKVVFRVYGNGDSYDLLQEYTLLDIGDPVATSPTDVFNVNFDFPHVPAEGESYSVGLFMQGKYGDGISKGDAIIQIGDYSASMTREEDSFYPATVSPCLTLWDCFNRLTEIYTGKVNGFESHLLDGNDSTLLTDSSHNMVLLPGGWVRNLKRKDDAGNLKEWPLELSFENAYKSIHAVLPVGYGISIHGNRQNIILEDLKFFFQRTVVGHLGKLKIIERSTASEYCYQSLKFGYIKGGDYEEPLGLDEYNTQMTSRTPLTIVDNEYEALGESRTDPYGVEYTRRYQYDDFPDADRNEDKDNFLIDVKDTQRQRRNKLFTVRTWQDDFEEAPTGTYAPETGFNYNLTPARNRQRHSWWFNNGIVKLQDKNIQFLNANGNSELKTKKVGENYLKENADVPIADLDKPLFEPEWIDAEKYFDQELLEKLLDTTLINGRRVNNYYGLWEFTNEQNRSEYAYIFTVKAKDKMTFKLLKAYGI
ncbi:hypothetical protein [Christiangramia crocea]|uniref:Uncharacterized protein n=1 Tax=Christiangramia crocea TaxID=2904124 RepID=A0A9X1UVB7_9FLAO|nr:hypothetical protein [Gramella crocea]MCG9970989.1 hypothetical protein [Gramella crocea]